MDSTNVGDFSSVIEKMKWEEPMIFTQMCVNMLKYIAPDMPNEATQRLLDIKQFYAQAAGGSGSIPSKVGKSGGDGSLFSSVGGSFGDGNICELSICHILIKYIENYCDKEGLFRIPGNKSRIEKLNGELEERNLINFVKKRYSHNDVCSVLKNYLRRNPASLIAHNLQKAHLFIAELTFQLDNERQKRVKTAPAQCASNDPEVQDRFQFCEVSDPLTEEFNRAKNRQIEAVQILIALMPRESFEVLKSLMQLLNSIAKRQSVNRMSATSLATIFTPNILWPLPTISKSGKNTFRHHSETDMEMMHKSCYAVTFMIRHFNRIFSTPHPELEVKVSQYFRAKQILSLARCTPTGNTSGHTDRNHFVTLSQGKFTCCNCCTNQCTNQSTKKCPNHQQCSSHNQKQNSGISSIRRTLFHNQVSNNEQHEITFVKPTNRELSSRKRAAPEANDDFKSSCEKKSKRSRSMGATIKSKFASSVANFRKTSTTNQCSTQQLYVQSELGGFVCSSPAGIKSPGNYQLLF